AAGVSRARSLDRRVQREEVGLLGDLLDGLQKLLHDGRRFLHALHVHLRCADDVPGTRERVQRIADPDPCAVGELAYLLFEGTCATTRYSSSSPAGSITAVKLPSPTRFAPMASMSRGLVTARSVAKPTTSAARSPIASSVCTNSCCRVTMRSAAASISVARAS